MGRKWYKGDTHLHTTNSDGVLTKGQLVEACKSKGLDFMIITDHNYNSVEKSYYDKDILVIQGQEITDKLGHVNVWGKKVPDEPPYDINDGDDLKKIIKKCKKAGATVSVNHPFCSNCPFLLDLEDFCFDCVEVWNTIQHSDNIKNRDWWVNQLLKGNKIAAVGGSDYHRNYVADILAVPTTIVHAKSNTEKDILDALREGRSVVTNSPDSSMIYISCGGAQIGDTVRLDDRQRLELRVTNLKRGHKITVYNNENIIYENTAKKDSKEFFTTADIEEKGFVRAEITYTLNPVLEKIYAFGEKKFLAGRGVKKDNSLTLPEFFWAFTNPIWVE